MVKEISWLHFNERVLDEAADPGVPLLERLKFLGIYSNNLDEFFRVRVGTLNRISRSLRKKSAAIIGHQPKKTLKKIHQIVVRQREKFDGIFAAALKELRRERIFIIDETQLSAAQQRFVEEYFHTTVRPKLFPIMLNQTGEFPELRDKSIYLAVTLSSRRRSLGLSYALIEIPTDALPRFVRLPSSGGREYIILLDDVIRYSLPSIFAAFGRDRFTAHTIKLTRDAELDIDDDVFESYVRKVHKSLKQRKEGQPVRLVYDVQIPRELLKFLVKRLRLRRDDALIAGSRYHNFKDFIKFPNVGRKELRYAPQAPIVHRALDPHQSILAEVAKRDLLLHFPYQTFDHVIDLLREASIDPHVTSIKITLYRTAPHSSIVNALMNAVKNGKTVVAVVELQARFDEEANIFWANELQEAGAKVVFGVPGLKVHAKLCLVTRRNGRGVTRYAIVATGNFNEDTARVYTDHFLFTANPKITEQVAGVFEFLQSNYKVGSFRNFLVSPFSTRRKIQRLIEAEMKNAAHGKDAWLLIKLNHLTDPQMIELLQRASQAGVKIRLIIRGMFTLKPGVPGLSENISAIRLVDKYLEHARVLVFANGGDPKLFITSADWMPRNLDRRVEVGCPVLDPLLRSEIIQMLEMQWHDNVKAGRHTEFADGKTPSARSVRQHRAQLEIYDFLKGRQRQIDRP